MSCTSYILGHHAAAKMNCCMAPDDAPRPCHCAGKKWKVGWQGCLQRSKTLIKPAVPLSAAGTMYSTSLILNQCKTSNFQWSVSDPEDINLPSSGCRRFGQLPKASENEFSHHNLCFHSHFNHFSAVEEWLFHVGGVVIQRGKPLCRHL